jgi:hypothetical protein
MRHLRDCARDLRNQAEGWDGESLCPFTGKQRETCLKKRWLPKLPGIRTTKTETCPLARTTHRGRQRQPSCPGGTNRSLAALSVP